MRTITRSDDTGGATWVIRTLHGPRGETPTATVMIVRASDLALVSHVVRAANDSMSVTAAGGRLTGWVVLPPRPVRLLDDDLDRPVFAVEGQVPWLFPLLPLRDGYRAAVPHYSPWDGGERWMEVRVDGRDTVTAAGRTWDCWVVDAGRLGPPGYRVHRWVDRRSRRVVQSVLRGAPGQPEYWSRLRASP